MEIMSGVCCLMKPVIAICSRLAIQAAKGGEKFFIVYALWFNGGCRLARPFMRPMRGPPRPQPPLAGEAGSNRVQSPLASPGSQTGIDMTGSRKS